MFHGLMDLVEMLPAAEYAVMGHFCRILLVLEVLCPGTLSKNTKTSDTKKWKLHGSRQVEKNSKRSV